MNHPEEAVQRAIVEWLLWNERRWKGLVAWFAVPNQRGTRTAAENKILKAMGVRAGVSDLVFLFEGGAFCVEVKATGRRNAISESQLAWMEDCARIHVPYFVVESVEELVEIMERYEVLRPERSGGADERRRGAPPVEPLNASLWDME